MKATSYFFRKGYLSDGCNPIPEKFRFEEVNITWNLAKLGRILNKVIPKRYVILLRHFCDVIIKTIDVELIK
jgi:hypothetical protein